MAVVVNCGLIPKNEPIRIGLISDTHEADDPVGLTQALADLECDFYVHLGDVGGSKPVMQAIRLFKRDLGALDSLNEAQRQDYHRLVGEGLSPMRAYGDAFLGTDPAGREQRRRETQENYLEVLRALGALGRAFCLAGNVDRALFKAGIVGGPDARHRVELVTAPLWLDCGSSAVVLWPSMRIDDDNRKARLAAVVDEIIEMSEQKSRVVVLAHEQVFRGPPPLVYKRRIQSQGLDAVTIPWFEPNPTWRCLLSLFRALVARVEAGVAFGHVHDPQPVLEAGASYLSYGHRGRMVYRVYGLGHEVPREERSPGRRRTVSMWYVPTNTVARLSLGVDGIQWEVFER